MRLKVGIVGCGLISQIVHLPNFRKLAELYEIRSICDISTDLAERVAVHYNVPTWYSDYRQLLDDNLDAVFVLTRDHAEIAIAAAQSGKHVFVEKPLAFNTDQAKSIIHAANAHQRKLMVGYMRRFDPGVRYAQQAVNEMEGGKFIRWHTSLGSPNQVVNVVYQVIHSQNGIPPSIQKEAAEKEKVEELRAIGNEDPLLFLTYRLLLHLWIHEINILRSTFNVIPEIPFAMVKNTKIGEGMPSIQVLAALNYPGKTSGVWETQAFMSNENWDDQFAVFGNEKTIRVDLPHPYLQNNPSRVWVESNSAGNVKVEELHFPHLDGYYQELIHFHECITQDRQPLTSGQEALEDIDFITRMVRKAVIV